MQKNDGLTGKDKRNLTTVCLVGIIGCGILDTFFTMPSVGLLYGALVSALCAILGVDEFAKRRRG